MLLTGFDLKQSTQETSTIPLSHIFVHLKIICTCFLFHPSFQIQTCSGTDKQAVRQAIRETGRQTGRQTGNQTDRQTDRQSDRQAGRQTDRQTKSNTYSSCVTFSDKAAITENSLKLILLLPGRSRTCNIATCDSG